jgi:hypothetical protein
MFVVVATDRWEAYRLYRDLEIPREDGSRVNHFNQIERDRMSLEEVEVYPLGKAHQYVPSGVIWSLDDFTERLPMTFVVNEEPPLSP